jgi:hypothetical protein
MAASSMHWSSRQSRVVGMIASGGVGNQSPARCEYGVRAVTLAKGRLLCPRVSRLGRERIRIPCEAVSPKLQYSLLS